jgi:hypothetical protein
VNLPENSQSCKTAVSSSAYFSVLFLMNKLKMKKVMMNIINWIMKTGNRLCGSAYRYPKLIIVTGKVIRNVNVVHSP